MVENIAAPENSWRIRTQAAVSEPGAGDALPPVCRMFVFSSSVERPRSTSKSGLNEGCFGMRERADAICCCSSAEGAQTFRTLTLTCGCEGCWEKAICVKPRPARTARIFRSTKGIVTGARKENSERRRAKRAIIVQQRTLHFARLAQILRGAQNACSRMTIKLSHHATQNITMNPWRT